MVRGKKIEGIDDTPENVVKAMFRKPIRRSKRKVTNTEGQTVKIVVVDTGDKHG